MTAAALAAAPGRAIGLEAVGMRKVFGRWSRSTMSR